jgi:hypothetical protein
MKYYRLKNKELLWGDYGDILLAGMTTRLDRYDGKLQLERTGPFQPNLIISGIQDLLVTDSFKHEIQRAGISNLDFIPVIKKHISLVDWTTWDLSAEEPQLCPESGEPEGYILELPHSVEVANQMENVWEILVPEHKDVKDEQDIFSGDISLEIVKVNGWIVVTEKMRVWLEENQADWIEFEEPKTEAVAS